MPILTPFLYALCFRLRVNTELELRYPSFMHSYSFIKVSDIMQQPGIMEINRRNNNTINACVK